MARYNMMLFANTAWFYEWPLTSQNYLPFQPSYSQIAH